LASAGAIDALVFDLGNVLVDIDFGRAFASWSAQSGVPARELAARFQIDAAYCAHERGEMDECDYFAALRRRLGIALADEAMLAGWNAIIGEPLPGIDALVARLAACFPLYVFSNTNPAHYAHFAPRHRTLLSYFRNTIVSCDIGSRKPDPEAFRRMAALTGMAPGRLAFFDDLEDNVQGAREAGLHAFRVSAPAEIAAISERLVRERRAG
jgi:putative hydrolase of the HAD superfamily